jgi:hypothetical protein
MMDVEHIFQEIQQLPVSERQRLVERVVHELGDAPPAESQPQAPLEEPSLLGLFEDDAEAVDEMMKVVMENRRRSALRSTDTEDE